MKAESRVLGFLMFTGRWFSAKQIGDICAVWGFFLPMVLAKLEADRMIESRWDLDDPAASRSARRRIYRFKARL